MPWDMMMTKPDTDHLGVLFESARATPPEVPEALLDRILADAHAVQPATPRRNWRMIWTAIGGAPAFGGMVTATVVGFWIGMAVPGSLPDFATQIISGETVIFADDEGTSELTAFGWDMEER